MSFPLSSILTAAAALVAVIGLVLLAGRAARATGLGAARPGARLRVQESLPLDRARSLRIVRCDGRDLLLLIGGGADVVVGWLSGPERDA